MEGPEHSEVRILGSDRSGDQIADYLVIGLLMIHEEGSLN